jgi:DNA-binding MarR family transcriptional regulator
VKHRTTTRDTVSVLADDLRLAVARLVRQLRQHNNTGTPVTLTLRSALATLDREGPLTPSELASHEGVSAPSMTRIVRRLTEEGLIDRDPDPHDGRGYLITVSAEGAAMLRSARLGGSNFLETRLRQLDRRQLELVPVAIEVLEALLAESPTEDQDS